MSWLYCVVIGATILLAITFLSAGVVKASHWTLRRLGITSFEIVDVFLALMGIGIGAVTCYAIGCGFMSLWEMLR